VKTEPISSSTALLMVTFPLLSAVIGTFDRLPLVSVVPPPIQHRFSQAPVFPRPARIVTHPCNQVRHV